MHLDGYLHITGDFGTQMFVNPLAELLTSGLGTNKIGLLKNAGYEMRVFTEDELSISAGKGVCNVRLLSRGM